MVGSCSSLQHIGSNPRGGFFAAVLCAFPIFYQVAHDKNLSLQPCRNDSLFFLFLLGGADGPHIRRGGFRYQKLQRFSLRKVLLCLRAKTTHGYGAFLRLAAADNQHHWHAGQTVLSHLGVDLVVTDIRFRHKPRITQRLRLKLIR